MNNHHITSLFKSLLFALLSSIFTSLLFVNNTFATSNVSFEGGAESFVFNQDSQPLTSTDIFSNLKNALPGDTLTDYIAVRNDSPDYYAVQISLRADPHDESSNPLSPSVTEHETITTMNDFLSQLTMKVYNDSQLIYESTPDQASSLTDYLPLGVFKRGESTLLRIELSVPPELSNEYAHRYGEVDWIFLAEEIAAPNTGLFTNPSELIVPSIALAIIIAIIAVVILHRKPIHSS